MIFIKAFLFFIVVAILLFVVVYLNIVIVFNTLNFLKKKIERNEFTFFYDFDYKGKSGLKLFLSFFLLIHSLLFIDYYRSYIHSKTKYYDAKVYYVAGLLPHTYSVLLGRFVSPLNPIVYGITKPTNLMKEYLFEKGLEHIPQDDAERELWEYEWFFYPYLIHSWDMYDSYHKKRVIPTAKISKETHDYYFERVERLYKIIKTLNEHKIADLYREADSLKKIPLMTYYFKTKGSFLYGENNNISKVELKKEWKVFEVKQSQIKNWLQAIPDKLDKQMQFQEWGNVNLRAFFKIEATRRFVLLEIMQNELFNEIHANKFHCKNKSTQDYIDLRNRFIMGGNNSILDRLAYSGGEKDAYIMQGHFKDWTIPQFFKLMLKKYCSEVVLGESKYRSDFKDKHIISDKGNGKFPKLIRILNKGKENE